LHPGATALGIDENSAHRGQVDHEATVRDAEAEHAVPAAANAAGMARRPCLVVERRNRPSCVSRIPSWVPGIGGKNLSDRGTARARDGRWLGIARVLGPSAMFGRPPCVLLGLLVMTLGRAGIAYAFGPFGGATFNLRHAFVHRGRALMGLCEALSGLRSAARHR
jgi:hypothetical protein